MAKIGRLVLAGDESPRYHSSCIVQRIQAHFGRIGSMSYVLVVGAGPTGLTLACELAVRGVPHRLVDMAPGPFPGSRAKGLQPRTLEVFDRLGIVDEIVGAGLAELPYRQHTADGGFHDVPRPGLGVRPDVPWPSPLVIPQWRTEAALRKRLESLGGRVEYATTLAAVDVGTDGVRATLEGADGSVRVDVAWLVGCDGARSMVRHAARLNLVGETNEDMRMLVGDMRVVGADRDHRHVWRPAFGDFMSLAPLAGTDAFQVHMRPPADRA
jgi:2-polyprenyl-6-methoxyphenol hydroxylase-like FAD-dependent oxidoreductase